MVKFIVIDCKKKVMAMKEILWQGKQCFEEGLLVLIFFEGICVFFYEIKDYLLGGVLLVVKVGCQVLLIVYNVGLYWLVYKLVKVFGEIIVKIGKFVLVVGCLVKELNYLLE